MNSKYLFVAFLMATFGHLIAVIAKPYSSSVQDFELIESVAWNRTRRDLGASAVVAVIYGIGLASLSIANSNKCSATAGCHKGFCWAWCGVSLTGGEWCYTTHTYSQSYEYIPCKYDSECNECWKCAGACTVWIATIAKVLKLKMKKKKTTANKFVNENFKTEIVLRLIV